MPKLDLSRLPVQPAGFGRCAVCAYRESGTAALCFTCARERMERLSAIKCKTCDRPLNGAKDRCPNPICSSGDRQFLWNYAVAMRSGFLESAINAYKYNDKREWAQIFARVLVGFLDEESRTFEQFNLIVASPTYVSRGGRTWDHTRTVIKLAYSFSSTRWPFDVSEPPAIVKTAETPKLPGKRRAEREYIAETSLRNALEIPDRKKTAGKVILVYDDVFTSGLTLNEVARCLKKQGGAREVCGVTLARQPWKG